jgi:hypothetical protein
MVVWNNEVIQYQQSRSGLEVLLVEQNIPMTLLFSNISSTTDCLNNVTLLLTSDLILPNTRIKFAQGSEGVVSFSIPSPPNTIVDTPLRQRRCHFWFIICWWWRTL